MEAEKAQDSQEILANPCRWHADEPDSFPQDVRVTIDKIEDFSIGVAIERIHCEIAPHRIRRPIVGKRDLRPPAVSLDVVAKRRHLERPLADGQRDRAMREPGWM